MSPRGSAWRSGRRVFVFVTFQKPDSNLSPGREEPNALMKLSDGREERFEQVNYQFESCNSS